MNRFISISILSALSFLLLSVIVVRSETIHNDAANESTTCLVDNENSGTDSSGAAGGSEKGIDSLLENCRDNGFDPWNLSCDTCAKLYNNPATKKYFEHLQPSCDDCCQQYKASGANKILSKPYESALIVQTILHNDGGNDKSSTQNSEVDDFLNDDYMQLLEEKSSKRILRIKRLYDPYTAQRSSMRYSVFGPRPTTYVYFFDTIVPEFAKFATQQKKQQEQSKNKKNTYEFSLHNAGNHLIDEDKYTEMAKEIIQIDDGWKRDDIRDMIQTLLPDEAYTEKKK